MGPIAWICDPVCSLTVWQAEPPKRLRRRQTAAATMRRRLSRLDIPIQPPDAPVAPPPAAGRTTQLTPLSSLESMALGVLAGTIETIVVQPMIFCKNMIQQSLPLSADPRLLFRGKRHACPLARLRWVAERPAGACFLQLMLLACSCRVQVSASTSAPWRS